MSDNANASYPRPHYTKTKEGDVWVGPAVAELNLYKERARRADEARVAAERLAEGLRLEIRRLHNVISGVRDEFRALQEEKRAIDQAAE